MTTPSSTFALKLDDQVSAPAETAADAMEDLKKQIEGDTKALRDMRRAFRDMNKGAVVSIGAASKLREAIKAKEQSLSDAQSKFVDLGGAFGSTAKRAKPAQDAMKATGAQVSGLEGRIQGLKKGFSEFRATALGSAVMGGLATLAKLVLAVAAATVTATAALLKYGIAQADAARSERLRLEGLTTLRSRYGQAAMSAGELQSAIDAVEDSTAAGRGQLEGYTRRLYRMGLRGENLRQTLEGMAIVADVQGERFAQRFAGMAAGAARSGRSVRALADDVRARLGGQALRRMMSLDVQSRRLGQSLARITGGVEIEGLLRGLFDVSQLLSQSTVTGRNLKRLFEGLFQPLIDGLTASLPMAKRFFQGMVVAALQFGIVVLTLRNRFRETFGDRRLLGGIDGMRLALLAGKAAVFGVIAVIGAAGVVAAAFAASIAAIAAPTMLAAAALVQLWKKGSQAVAFLRGINWGELGAQIVNGLVTGIRSRATAVTEALRGVASSATGTIREALGIRSPSRVFAALGVEVPRGFAQGVEAGSPVAQAAVDQLVRIPAPSVPDTGGLSIGGRSSISVGPFEINIVSPSPEATADMLREQLASILEGVLAEAGAA